MKKILVAICGLLVSAAIFPARAAASSFLHVEPGVVELSVTSARPVKGVLTVTNADEEKTLCTLSVRNDWAAMTRLPSPEPSSWLTIKPFPSFPLRPGASRKVRYTATPPPGFTGETMAMVLFSGSVQGATAQSGGVRFTQGIPIYMIASGTERYSLQVSAIYASRNREGEIEFSFHLKNNGNVHVRPTGAVVVQAAGDPSKKNMETSYGTPVFPGNSTVFFARSVGAKDWPAGEYSGRVTFSEKGKPLCAAVFDFAISSNGEVRTPRSVAEVAVTP